MKTLNIYEIAEMQFLFIDNKCVQVTMLNDAEIRKEYHEPLFTALGVKVVNLDELNAEQLLDVKTNFAYCLSGVEEFKDD